MMHKNANYAILKIAMCVNIV